jgi:hypothetical protein
VNPHKIETLVHLPDWKGLRAADWAYVMLLTLLALLTFRVSNECDGIA